MLATPVGSMAVARPADRCAISTVIRLRRAGRSGSSPPGRPGPPLPSNLCHPSTDVAWPSLGTEEDGGPFRRERTPDPFRVIRSRAAARSARSLPVGNAGCVTLHSCSSAERALCDGSWDASLRRGPKGIRTPDLLAASQTRLNGVLCSENAGHEPTKRPLLCAEAGPRSR